MLDDTPDDWQDTMKDLMDEVLKTSNQPEASRIFQEIIEGDRQKMVTVVGEEGQTEEIDAYKNLRKEAAWTCATLKEYLEDATSMLVLPGKYRRRLRTTNMIERLIGTVWAEKHKGWSNGKYLDIAEFRNWKEQTHRRGPEPDESPDQQPVIVT